MRALWLLVAGVMGCSSELEIAPVVDAEGEWTAEFLVNTTTDSPGDDVNDFGTLTLEPASYVPDPDFDHIPGEHVGNAKLESIAYAAQGSLTDPDVDADGHALYENVGSVVLRGTWRADAVEPTDEPITSLTLDLNCEEVNLTSDRTDLQAICGDPFLVTLTASCERPEGSSTLQCNFSSTDGTIVLSRN